jgi:hypothetical protein
MHIEEALQANPEELVFGPRSQKSENPTEVEAGMISVTSSQTCSGPQTIAVPALGLLEASSVSTLRVSSPD